MCETCKALADSLENTRLEVEGAIAIVTMDRPKALNALSDKTLNELDRIFTYLAGAEEILGIILTGEGKGFVAGADISQMQPYGPSEGRAYADRAQTLFNKIEGIEKPVIAAVNGYALGGGCELALACDIRIATRRSKFGQPEVSLGLIPGAGGTQRLVRLIGPGRAKELIFSGAILTAEQALTIGLINRVTDDSREAVMAEAEALAKQIMTKGPVAVALAKICVNMGGNTDLGTGLMLERMAQTIALSTQDRKEGTAAFLEKRPARFQGC